MSRIGYVILTHNEPINLLGLIGSLWNSEDAFSVWIDAKAEPQFIQFAQNLGDIDRISVNVGPVINWAGFSIVDTTLHAYRDLVQKFSDFSHVVLCSGTHIPLRHPDRIYKEVSQSAGWMDFAWLPIGSQGLGEVDNMPAGWARDVLSRFRYRYIELDGVGMLPAEDRPHWIEPRIVKGSQWHVLRRDIVDYILHYRPDISQNFSDVLVADEHAFQWAASKSPRFGDIKKGDHVFMEWEGPSPRRLSFQEAEEIASSGRFLFARKAQIGVSAEDWICWIHDKLGNGEGAEWLRRRLTQLLPSTMDRRTRDTGQGGKESLNALGLILKQELAIGLRGDVTITAITENRHLIDTNRRHLSGGRVFLLCFSNPALGISVVPALRDTDLGQCEALRARPHVPFFRAFRNLPIGGGSVGWVIRPIDAPERCKALVQSLLAELSDFN